MAKDDPKQTLDRIANMNTGNHLGGTKFGQTTGAATIKTGKNKAQPEPTDASGGDKS